MSRLSQLFKIIFLTTTFLTLSACCEIFKIDCPDDDDDVENPQSENPNADAILFASYERPDSNTDPKIDLDLSRIQGPIQIVDDPLLTSSGVRFDLTFSGVTFKEADLIYEVKSIITQVNDGQQWSTDDENFLKFEFSKSLAVVLVLDVSSSLGDNLTTVKQRASAFVRDILNRNREAAVAVVKFSRGNVAIDFSSNPAQLSSFINNTSQFTDNILGGGTYNLEGRDETALYEAMISGINLLEGRSEMGKAIVTFTDGQNNFQFDIANENPTAVTSGLNGTSIQSYTIGFVGNANTINETVLNSLAIDGEFSKADNLEQLEDVFTKFSNNVSTIYDLIYDTSNSVVTKRNLRFLFELERTN